MDDLTLLRGCRACDHVMQKRASHWMQLVETSLAVGQVAFAAGLEAHPGWLHITDVAVRNGLLSLSVLLETEDDV